MAHETIESQNSFQAFFSATSELQREFDLVFTNFNQNDLLNLLGIPSGVYPEFENEENLQNLLFFEFINQVFAIYLASQIENQPNGQVGQVFPAVQHLQDDFGLEILFQPNIISELENVAPNLIRQLFALLSQLNLDEVITSDLLGSYLQNLLSQATRKRFAANYTILDGAQLLAHLAIAPQFQRIIDPMGGSGRLIFSSLDAFNAQGITFSGAFPRMILNEIFLPAVQLFYSKLLIRILGESGGSLDLIRKLTVATGDAFQNFQANSGLGELLNNCDLVIMNPPFTRQGLLEKNYRTFLAGRFAEFTPYINRHMGLHGYALFLAHELLHPGGMIAAVLPAATIYSGYGAGLKQFLLDNYDIHIILTSAIIKAFSEGSDFRELILICTKKGSSEPSSDSQVCSEVKFVTVKQNMLEVDLPHLAAEINAVTQDGETERFKVAFVPQEQLGSDKNWLYFFESGDFKELYQAFTTQHSFLSSSAADFRLVRGFEMYGPNYFLLPNKFWQVAEELPDAIIFAPTKVLKKEEQIEMPRQYLITSLRKPQECEAKITFDPGFYAFSVPKSTGVPAELEDYVGWGNYAAQPAIKRYGKDWLYHVNAQLESKQPFGHVFVVDKIAVNGIHNFAYYFPESITCTKNFYVFQTQSAETDEFLAAWLNSSVFLLLFLAQRREIGGSYGRLQIADYKAMPLFVEIDPSNNAFNEVLGAFRTMCAIDPLPLLQDQFEMPERIALDHAIMSYLSIAGDQLDALRGKIYSAIRQKLESLEARD
jgi:hypothetical protein